MRRKEMAIEKVPNYYDIVVVSDRVRVKNTIAKPDNITRLIYPKADDTPAARQSHRSTRAKLLPYKNCVGAMRPSSYWDARFNPFSDDQPYCSRRACEVLTVTECSQRECPFRKKWGDHVVSISRAAVRLHSLPEAQQQHIADKYHSGTRPWMAYAQEPIEQKEAPHVQ